MDRGWCGGKQRKVNSDSVSLIKSVWCSSSCCHPLEIIIKKDDCQVNLLSVPFYTHPSVWRHLFPLKKWYLTLVNQCLKNATAFKDQSWRIKCCNSYIWRRFYLKQSSWVKMEGCNRIHICIRFLVASQSRTHNCNASIPRQATVSITVVMEACHLRKDNLLVTV